VSSRERSSKRKVVVEFLKVAERLTVKLMNKDKEAVKYAWYSILLLWLTFLTYLLLSR